jgi:GNAT superfamily N-acetyltransferase
MSTRIRPMSNGDSAAVATLCGQLGYPTAAGDVARRLDRIAAQPLAALLVAEEQSRVVGWIHVAVTPVLESDLYAEIAGLVVDADHRGRRIGEALLEAAEQWAHAAGCSSIRVRSRIARERAHAFYERHGFERIKTQHAFEKRLVAR